jgi:hypothetical protein
VIPTSKLENISDYNADKLTAIENLAAEFEQRLHAVMHPDRPVPDAVPADDAPPVDGRTEALINRGRPGHRQRRRRRLRTHWRLITAGRRAARRRGRVRDRNPRFRRGLAGERGEGQGRDQAGLLTTAWRSPAFLGYALRIWLQARRSPGIMGLALRAQPLKATFWTLSAWSSQAALRDFAR